MKPAQLFPIESAGKKERIDILLVDDLPANLLALEALLAGEDYTLVQASSGPKALRCVAYSGAIRPPIPVESGHSFRANPATRLDQSGHRVRRLAASA